MPITQLPPASAFPTVLKSDSLHLWRDHWVELPSSPCWQINYCVLLALSQSSSLTHLLGALRPVPYPLWASFLLWAFLHEASVRAWRNAPLLCSFSPTSGSGQSSHKDVCTHFPDANPEVHWNKGCPGSLVLAPGKQGYKGCRLWPWAAIDFLLERAQHRIWGLVMKGLNSHIFKWGNCSDAGPLAGKFAGISAPGAQPWGSRGRVGSFISLTSCQAPGCWRSGGQWWTAQLPEPQRHRQKPQR